jgi:hypothetical protein
LQEQFRSLETTTSAGMIDGNLYEGPIDVKNVLIIYQNIYLNVVNAGSRLATAAEETDFSYSECTLFVT